jgi:MFS family permease
MAFEPTRDKTIGLASMKARSLGVFVIFLSAVFYWVSFSMLRPMLALYFGDKGFDVAIVGIFMAVQSMMPLLFAIPLGGLIDLIGPRRSVFIGSLAGVASGLLLLGGALYEQISLVVASQIINGIGSILIWTALQAAVSLSAKQREDKSARDKILSQFSFVNSLAQLAGPTIGGFFSEYGGYTAVFILFGMMNAAGLLLACWLPKEGRAKNRDISFRFWTTYGAAFRLMRDNRAYASAIGLNAVLFILVDARMTFVPLFLSNHSFSHAQIGTLLGVAAAATMIIRPFVDILLKRMSYHLLMSLSILIGGICMVLLSLAPPFWLIAGVMFGWGICTGVNQPLALIMVSNVLDDDQLGMGMSIRSMSNRTVQGLNPVFFGSISTVMGLSFAFSGMGGCLLLFGLIHLLRRKPANRTLDASS